MAEHESNDEGTPAEEAPKAPEADSDGMNTDAGKRALKAERDARKALEAQVAELTPLAEAARKAEADSLSELDRLTKSVNELTAERDGATLALARSEVALAKGLTPAQAKRLVGTTVEELSADADELVEDLKPSAPSANVDRQPRENLAPGSGDPESTPTESAADAGARMFSS